MLIPGFSIRLPLYHTERTFRVIANVPPEVVGIQASKRPNEGFHYGQLAGKTPSLEQMNEFLKSSQGKMFSEVTDPTWLTYFMVQERMVSGLGYDRRVFLAGDAAHCHSPAGGQGMNMGIQDGSTFLNVC
jgi:2-polyprenyl-6-methoxyphenol hydroxylase-like FAD-dependent oxidoreductase